MRLLPFLLLFASQVAAQHTCNVSFTGSITDEVNNTPLPGVSIYLDELQRGVLTDSAGYFRMDSICPGKYTVSVRYISYDSIKQRVELQDSHILDFSLKQSVRNLTEIDIIASKAEARSVIASDSVSQTEMAKARGGTLTDYLKQISGVNTLQTGSTIQKPVIHGLHSQRILIMNAGVRQEGQQWGSEHAPDIDPFIAGKITVLKGASAVRYGSDAIGGVIIVEPRELPHAPGLNAEISLNGMSNGRQGAASAMVEQHLGKFYDLCWRLQGTLKKAGNIHTPEVYLQNTGYKEENWSAAAGLERKMAGIGFFYSRFGSETGIFTGSHIGNLSDLFAAIANGEVRTDNRFSYEIGNPRQEVKHELLSLKAWLEAGTAGKLQLQYGYQFNRRREFDLDRLYNDSVAALELPELELRLYTQTLDISFESVQWKGFNLVAGTNALIQDNQYGGLRYFVPNYRLTNVGGYTLLRWRKSRWEIEGGGRLDIREQTVYRNINGNILSSPYSFRNPGASVGFIRRQNEKLSLQLNLSYATRSPSINEWFSSGLHHGTATYETGDTTLGAEQVRGIQAGASWQSSVFSLSLTAYYTFIKDYIYLMPAGNAVLTINGAFPAFNYSTADALFRGADLSFEASLNPKLKWQSRNSIVFGENLSDNTDLLWVPSPKFTQTFIYTFRNAGKWKDIQSGMSFLSVMRQTRYENGSDFAQPPPAYHLIGIEASGILTLRKQEFRIGLSVSNLLNTTYRDYMNRFRYYAPAQGTNIMLRLNIPLTFRTAVHSHEH